MKDYASMSDFEINCRVAIALGMKEHFFMNAEGDNDFDDEFPLTERGPIWQTCKYRVGDYKPSNGNCFNPCNNPADAWPIITSSMISIRPVGNDGQLWEASGMGGMKADYDKNPLRSAMVVFLMMKESENDSQS